MILDQLFGNVFAACQHLSARIAARIGYAHQLQKTRDILRVESFAMKLLKQIEHDVWLPFVKLRADGC